MVVTLRAQLTPSWLIKTNLNGRLDIGDVRAKTGGVKFNCSSEIKPAFDPIVSNQIAEL